MSKRDISCCSRLNFNPKQPVKTLLERGRKWVRNCSELIACRPRDNKQRRVGSLNYFSQSVLPVFHHDFGILFACHGTQIVRVRLTRQCLPHWEIISWFIVHCSECLMEWYNSQDIRRRCVLHVYTRTYMYLTYPLPRRFSLTRAFSYFFRLFVFLPSRSIFFTFSFPIFSTNARFLFSSDSLSRFPLLRIKFLRYIFSSPRWPTVFLFVNFGLLILVLNAFFTTSCLSRTWFYA